MQTILKIFCLIIICGSSLICKTQENFRYSAPEFIPYDKPFEISIITSRDHPDADELLIFLSPKEGLIINGVTLNSNNNFGLPVFISSSSRFNMGGYELTIDLTDTSQIGTAFFQILINCENSNVDKSELILKGVFLKNKQPIGYFRSKDNLLTKLDHEFYTARFNFYKQSKLPDQAVKFLNNSSLSVPLTFNYSGKIISEFWIKIDKAPINFLKIRNSQTTQTEYILSVNDFQILNAASDHNILKHTLPNFVSKNIWYHLTLLFDDENFSTNFYCNGKLFASIEFPSYINPNDLELEFKNVSAYESFSIEQFRIYDITGTKQSAFKNKNFRNINSDSLKVLLQINFNEYELYQLTNAGMINYNNLKFTKSDAPIFPRAPVINVELLNNYFEIEWKGGDFKNAKYYSLERSDDNGNFVEIYNIDAESSNNKLYSFISEKAGSSELVYFRVKQINTDGSEVYSAQAKIGQGIMEDVVLDQNYPNPFNPVTQIEFELMQDGDVVVKIYDLEGQEVAVLQNGFLSKGIYKYKFDGSDLPSGIYLYKVSTSQSTQTKKMILAK